MAQRRAEVAADVRQAGLQAEGFAISVDCRIRIAAVAQRMAEHLMRFRVVPLRP
jgi:hypothetical protein